MKKDKDKKINKTVEKTIVNGLTLSRVAGTIAMPMLFNSLSAPVFLLVVAAILFTDCLDGILARHWKVSTIFGSIADMGADKLFGFAVLVVLSTMYPVMRIPLILETLIAGVNIKAAENNSIAKSSEIGRIKTWVMGLSMCSLLMTGLSPELATSLESVNIQTINPAMNELLNLIKEIGNKILDFVNQNKQTIESIATTAAITSESIVATDYTIKSIKVKDKNSESYKWADIITKKKFWQHLRKIVFDEKYYEATKEQPFIEKITTTELREEIKRKKLIPDE